MNPYLIQFSGDGATEDRIQNALSDKGIRSIRVQSLSKLHLLAITGSFDAIIVGTTTVERYAMSPIRHLWEARSRMSIITWEEAESGTIVVKGSVLPHAVIGPGRASRLSHVIAVVKNALRELDARGPQPIAGQERDDRAMPLRHGKIGHLYRLLASSRTTGADVERIREELWPGDSRARKDDIQAYASKLRRILRVAYPGRFALVRDRNRYILREL